MGAVSFPRSVSVGLGTSLRGQLQGFMRQRESSCDRPQSSSIPNPGQFSGRRFDPHQVGLGLHNTNRTNRHDIIHGPTITVPPPQAKVGDARLSCRTAVLEAIERLQQRTGATHFARRDIVAEVQADASRFGRQTIYRCLRRLSGQEPGSAYHDLEDLGDDRLRLRD
jgi:hypothetical protein